MCFHGGLGSLGALGQVRVVGACALVGLVLCWWAVEASFRGAGLVAAVALAIYGVLSCAQRVQARLL